MSMYDTDQEVFWAGNFGTEYINRNKSNELLAGNINLFSKIISRMQKINSVIEFGSNIGLNLIAIKYLCPYLDDIDAIEINHEAVEILRKSQIMNRVYEQSIFDFNIDYQRDLVLIKGVLIHLNPDKLELVYKLLYETSKRYICIAEYYNPTPVELPYRGHDGKLFKRDFAGEMLDIYKDLSLLDYGFSYRRDNHFPQDDITWFLLEKK